MKRRSIYIVFLIYIFSCKVTAANYYWVGGSGDWNQLGHWATTSGGTTFHTQIPTIFDDIFFDGASFTSPNQVVTINAPTAVCHNMNWTGVTNSPTFLTDPGHRLNIHGSLTLTTGMFFQFNGLVSFEATTSGNTIFCAGHSFGVFVFSVFVRFNGDGGWILLDSLKSPGTVQLIKGVLNTNNQVVNIYRFASPSGLSRTLNMGSSVFNLTSWEVEGTGLILNAGTSLINMRSSIAYAGFSGGDLVYHDLNFSGPGTTYGEITGNNTFNDVSFATTAYIRDNNIFHNLTLSRHGTIYANNTYNDLLLASGYTYTLSSATTQIINGSLTANGDCSAPITIITNTTGNQATIIHPPGTVTVAFVSLRDINGAGGAVFTANNSIDLGNNTGWIINALTGQNLYWVGNGGNFNDSNHWSTTSGGTPSGCIPTPADNVFFDANSFSLPSQIVSTNGIAYCHDMNWVGASNNPRFVCPVSDFLKIYGSLQLSGTMQADIDGLVYFEANTTGKTITTAGKTFATVLFNGIGGGWTLQDALTGNNSSSSILLINGALNTNNQTVTTGAFFSGFTTARSLIMGSSVFNLSNGSQCWFVTGTGMTLDAGTSTINSTNTAGSNFSGGSLVYYNLNFTGNGSIGDNNAFNDVTFGGDGTVYNVNTFNNAKFYKNGNIRNYNTYNNLLFSAGYNYILTFGATQTINNVFTADGTCTSRITIITNMGGSQSSISHPPGAVTLSYVTLKDINAVGGATFTVNNAVDLGNNTGWILNLSPSQDLYWIGNTGNWNDGNHWSYTSGGPPATCTPTALDNVFFDANSFSLPGLIVTINVPVAYCKTMAWTGAINNPTLAGPNFNMLKIYGSLTFISGMIQDFRGSVYFEATTPGKTITSASQSLHSSITFNGIGGNWTLIDSFTTTSGISFNNGTLNTNDQTVNANSFFSYTGTTRVLNMGSSIFNMSGLNIWDVVSTNMTLNAGTSTIRAINSGNAGPGLFRSNSGLTYYNVEFYNPYVTSTTISGSSTFNNVFFINGGIIQHSNTFNHVTFSKSGIIEDNNTFSTLVCTPTYTYTLGSGKTQVIQTNWEVTGRCVATIFLESSVGGNPAFVNKTAGTINAYYNQISDIHCAGGAIFNAHNSADAGGNSGWNFLNLPTLSTPDTIHGPINICPGQTAITYYVTPVQGAVSYTWTIPAGASIISGQGDTLIVVDFGNAVSGNVTLTTSNNCFEYTTKTLAVTVSNPVANSGPDASVCAGSNYTITNATASNYSSLSWTTNGTGVFINIGTLTPTYIASTTDISTGMVLLTLTATGNPACPADSDIMTLSFTPSIIPSVNITIAPAATICLGTTVTFTATPVNGGNSPFCQWMLNGISVGTNSFTYTNSTLANGDMVSVTMNSNAACATPATVLSNVITMAVSPNLNPAVTISAIPSGPVCAGTSVTFNAITTNAGSGTVSYIFKVNGIIVQNSPSNSFISNSFTNSDIVRCDINITGGICLSTASVSSNTITIKVNPVLASSVSIAVSPSGTVCQGTTLNFTTISINGGTSPVFLWQVNGISTGVSGATYTNNTLANGDIVTAVMTSNAICSSPAIVTSNSITVAILPLTPSSVTITASATSVCNGGVITFTALPVNGGSVPVYVWQLNNATVGTNSPDYISSTLVTGDILHCIMTSNATCAVPVTSVSNNISVTINSNPVVELGNNSVLCLGTNRILDAGSGYSFYLWNDGTNSQTIQVNTTGTYWVQVTNNNGCKGSDTIRITTAIIPTKNFLPPDTFICADSTMVLKPCCNFSSYLWSTSATTKMIIINQPGVYRLTVTDQYACKGNDTIMIRSGQCPKGFYVPNAFTPHNKDGLNDYFKPLLYGTIKQYYFAVFNRLGQIVFQTNDPYYGWDGSYNGRKQGTNVFVWMCRYQFDGEKIKLEKGTVTLIR